MLKASMSRESAELPKLGVGGNESLLVLQQLGESLVELLELGKQLETLLELRELDSLLELLELGGERKLEVELGDSVQTSCQHSCGEDCCLHPPKPITVEPCLASRACESSWRKTNEDMAKSIANLF